MMMDFFSIQGMRWLFYMYWAEHETFRVWGFINLWKKGFIMCLSALWTASSNMNNELNYSQLTAKLFTQAFVWSSLLINHNSYLFSNFSFYSEAVVLNGLMKIGMDSDNALLRHTRTHRVMSSVLSWDSVSLFQVVWDTSGRLAMPCSMFFLGYLCVCHFLRTYQSHNL